VSRVTGDKRYGEAAPFLVAFFRNGIAHSFLPKKAGPVVGYVVWHSDDESRTTCMDAFLQELGLPEFVVMREEHLGVKSWPNLVGLAFLPQVFCVDLLRTIAEMSSRLRAGDSVLVAALDAGFETWFSENATIRGAAGRQLADVLARASAPPGVIP